MVHELVVAAKFDYILDVYILEMRTLIAYDALIIVLHLIVVHKISSSKTSQKVCDKFANIFMLHTVILCIVLNKDSIAKILP